MSSEEMTLKPGVCHDDTSALYLEMRDAEVRYLAYLTDENRRELYDAREAWLVSLDGVKHLMAHGCQDAARHQGDKVMWRQWATSDNADLREHCAALTRDVPTLLTLCADPVPSVARQAHSNLSSILGKDWWEKSKPDPAWREE